MVSTVAQLYLAFRVCWLVLALFLIFFLFWINASTFWLSGFTDLTPVSHSEFLYFIWNFLSALRPWTVSWALVVLALFCFRLSRLDYKCLENVFTIVACWSWEFSPPCLVMSFPAVFRAPRGAGLWLLTLLPFFAKLVGKYFQRDSFYNNNKDNYYVCSAAPNLLLNERFVCAYVIKRK